MRALPGSSAVLVIAAVFTGGCANTGAQPPRVSLVCDVSPSPSMTVTWSEEFHVGSQDKVTWDFGDGYVFTSHKGSGPDNGHAYAKPGRYLITLSARGPGGSARDNCDVTVPAE